METKSIQKKIGYKERILNLGVLYNEKKNISEDYIVHLDYNLNHYHETELRGIMPQEIIEKHYFYLEKFLKKLSNTYNKEVKVCIHPRYNIKEHQKNLPDFEQLL